MPHSDCDCDLYCGVPQLFCLLITNFQAYTPNLRCSAFLHQTRMGISAHFLTVPLMKKRLSASKMIRQWIKWTIKNVPETKGASIILLQVLEKLEIWGDKNMWIKYNTLWTGVEIQMLCLLLMELDLLIKAKFVQNTMITKHCVLYV